MSKYYHPWLFAESILYLVTLESVPYLATLVLYLLDQGCYEL